jgi:hypothetical protein
VKFFAVLIAVLAAPAVVAQSPVIVRVPVRVVAVPTAVISTSGQFVRGLQTPDFQLFDNERSQNLRLDYVDGPLSLAVVVQTNDAVRAWLPEVRRVASAVEALLIGETGEASLSVFGDDVKVLQPMTGNSALLDKAFESIVPSLADKSRTWTRSSMPRSGWNRFLPSGDVWSCSSRNQATKAACQIWGMRSESSNRTISLSTVS